MHYQFKAMQKMLDGVGRGNNFSRRPVYEKFKQISASQDRPEENLEEIEKEIQKIETIMENNAKNYKQKCNSPKVAEMMEYIDTQMSEALNVYLEAWNLLAEIQKKKIQPKENPLENTDEGEKKQEREISETDMPLEERYNTEEEKNEEAGEKITDIIKELETFINEDTGEEENTWIIKAMEIAEDAEHMLMEIEKIMANTLNDNPYEG